MEDVSVNDGKGLYDNNGLIDTLIEDCNELPRDLMSGQNVRFCRRIVEMVQKLAQLKKGINMDMQSYKDQIAELISVNDELATKAFATPSTEGEQPNV